PLPQGHGSFLPIFARAWRGITLRHYRADLWKGKGDTRWLFFREENRRVQINACSTRRAVTLQPPPAPVPDLPQTRERVRRRYDCQPRTFSETLFRLAGRRRGATVHSVAGGDYQVLHRYRRGPEEADHRLVPCTVSASVFSLGQP